MPALQFIEAEGVTSGACWYRPGAVGSGGALRYIITLTSSGPTVIDVPQDVSEALGANSKQP